MKRFLRFFLFCAVMTSTGWAQAARHIVISEVAPMEGASDSYVGGEFVELYNPFSTDVTFGSGVVLVSGSTTATANSAEWQVSLAGKTIKGYGFFLVGESDCAVTPDIVLSSTKNLANSGGRSCVQLLDGTTVIDAFSWSSSSTLSGEGTIFTPSNTTSDKKSFQRKSGSSATANDALGDAWDAGNNATDFFENASSAANPQNSSSAIEINTYNLSNISAVGIASVSPAQWNCTSSATLSFIVKPDGDTVRSFKIVKPQLLQWSTGAIVVTPSSVTQSVTSDTATFQNFVLYGSDSIIVTIPGVTAADSTNEYTFDLKTSGDDVHFYSLDVQPSTYVYGSPRPMSWVKAKNTSGDLLYLNRYVVVKGYVTAANEFGGPSYLQDSTAGIAVYDSTVSQNVQRGDEVVVCGKVTSYYNMFELTPCTLLQTISQGNTMDTLTLTIDQIQGQNKNGAEPYESRLVRVTGITSVLTTSGSSTTSWASSSSGTNYELLSTTGSGTDTLEVRIVTKTNIANTSVPSTSFDIIGVLGQYSSYYQIIPRSYDDIIVEGAGPRIITSTPYENSMTADSITFAWQTDAPGTTIVQYGASSTYTSTIRDTNAATQHSITVAGLWPATVYHVRLGTANAAGTTYTNDYIVSTSSKSSTGTMNVFFNHSVDTTLSTGENANTTELSSKLIALIDSAKFSIDAALYSLSGTVGANVASALVAAHNRGVSVRVIGEADNKSTTPWATLTSGGITVIFDTYDATNAGAGLMHNKFVNIDNRDTTSDTDDWVWTGSWNATDPGNSDDAQNVITIQDKSLANAYTLEFEEMWGSSTNTPSSSNSRFGARKLDNTPHYFIVNGTPIQLYFSPSDGTTNKIINTLKKATHDIDFGLLTFTRSDIANALIALKKAGVSVRGVMSNKTDANSVFDTLSSSGIDVYLKNNTDVSGYFHHKYAIIDAGKASATQYVITGSHNWSSSAETANNENTLIISSNRIANLYLQEFSKRYTAAGGTQTLTGVEASDMVPKTYRLLQNYPNPFNPTTAIAYEVPSKCVVKLKVFDLLGREVATLINAEMPAGTYQVQFNASRYASGIYFYRLTAGSFISTRKMVLIK
jgi:phosphatidylserine/phosphatidylglycerophosphate/cardiolipin synthase-like enzyme